MAVEPSGRLELTWTNKHLRLLADEDGGYTWVPPSDYRVAEVRLLHDVDEVGETHGPTARARRTTCSSRVTRSTPSRASASCPSSPREYVGKVKLAYLDPPFNTQQAFAHYDDALEHSVWLTMMRDRLLQIRKLLAPDGSVYVHCDDSEQALPQGDDGRGLRARDTSSRRSSGRSATAAENAAKRFGPVHDYVLLYYAEGRCTTVRRGTSARHEGRRRRRDEVPNRSRSRDTRASGARADRPISRSLAIRRDETVHACREGRDGHVAKESRSSSYERDSRARC